LDPRILDVLAAIFAEEPLAAQSMLYFKPPTARGQALHQDDYYLKTKPGKCVAAWMALDPCDEENGAMMVVPGTQDMPILCPHQADPAKSFTRDEVDLPPGLTPVTIRMAPGDVLFFNGSVIHGSFPNTSRSRFRRSYIGHYVSRSTRMISQGYNPLLRPDGTEVVLPGNKWGGPCGEEQDLGA
jgi:ectoine hydroxylase-related dioxygenase (phytanoyl-CoA dioxygenase family)